MTPIPLLWTSPHGFLHRETLCLEADRQAHAHLPAISPAGAAAQLDGLRSLLEGRLRLSPPANEVEISYHGDVLMEGYVVRRISFLSAPGVRVTGSLYIPEGGGPFPAVLNMHGHLAQGKLAARVQARGHILALCGFVVLTVDAAGSGERADGEREWSYHGAMRAAELLLTGDTLLGMQVRDNMRAVDVLQSLPFVNGERIGATGESGGGNQTMWLAACDSRIKAAVPVVSVGSFRAYVGARNCLCETLPGGLGLAEEWMVLALVAPRALLVINALDDQPAFSYEAMSATCRQTQEIYAMRQARDRFDYRSLDMTHGYHRPALSLMRNWMLRWLAGEPEAGDELPDWTTLPEDALFCFPRGSRPEECGFRANRQMFRQSVSKGAGAGSRLQLARLVGWKEPNLNNTWCERRELSDGSRLGAITTSRGLTLPVAIGPKRGNRVRIILSPDGKKSLFAAEAWREAGEWTVVSADLPGTGELAWEDAPYPGSARFHDTARACLWLGHTLVSEWAEAIATLCAAFPEAEIEIHAEREAAFAALVFLALHPGRSIELVMRDVPGSLADPGLDSLVWCVPGILEWGDLEDVRTLAGA